ncbi:MAG TPA: bifunctional phosphoribosylaminoimidazolecarboxamide formyltransferase/IMP cyclohydrolase, partial [bacterium]|nr:bifunctional phosphoribosylaminoimidazolecarboxamide formyltransferase/IMP cyclohydrolase [bacterium]
MLPIRRALLSVSDKKGLVELGKFLQKWQVELLSTGGTARLLRENGLPVTDVSAFTGFPEILDGRVKTLHPKIYGGLLALRDNPEHQRQMTENNLVPIDLVVCNLYPFEATLARGAQHSEIIENIDIGGPCMIRAAAKNYAFVVVVVKPEFYPALMEEMEKNHGSVSEDFSFRCAREVYRLTSHYDAVIFSYLEKKGSPEKLPESLNLHLEKFRSVRYGENPHQQGAFYRQAGENPRGLSAAEILQGKELSFNNYLDLDAVLTGVREFEEPTAYIVKHLSPCGVASHPKLAEAYRLALECDPLSAFGGIVGFNREVDGETAEAILQGMEKYGFLECLLAPDFTAEARKKLAVKKNLRLVVISNLQASDPLD